MRIGSEASLHLRSKGDLAAARVFLNRRVYLNPDTGRFNRLDPWAGNTSDPQSLHKYAYAHCDPVTNVDPSGMLIGGIIEFLATAAIQFFMKIEHWTDLLGSVRWQRVEAFTMSQRFYTHSARFGANLLLCLLQIGMVIGLVAVFATTAAVVISDATKDEASKHLVLSWSEGLLLALLAVLMVVVLWKYLTNPTNFPSCLLTSIEVTPDQLILHILCGGDRTLSRDEVDVVPARGGFWVHWTDGDVSKRVLVRKFVFSDQSYAGLWSAIASERDRP